MQQPCTGQEASVGESKHAAAIAAGQIHNRLLLVLIHTRLRVVRIVAAVDSTTEVRCRLTVSFNIPMDVRIAS